jgi:3-oxoacyl-[acyl-carrier protein] reductase
MKTAVISGAAGGVGRELTLNLVRSGWHVIALDVLSDSPAPSSGTGRYDYYQVDATRREEIEKVARLVPAGTQDAFALISLAGIYDTYPITEDHTGKFLRMSEVNFLSVSFMVSSFLPQLADGGLVVVVSSESYKIQAPFQPYMVTKAALEAWCAAARLELSLLRARLTVIRPGAIATPLLGWMNRRPAFEGSAFARQWEAGYEMSLGMTGRPTDPARVVKVILRALESKKPKRVYRVNNNPLLSISSLIPRCLLDRLIILLLKKKSGKKI